MGMARGSRSVRPWRKATRRCRGSGRAPSRRRDPNEYAAGSYRSSSEPKARRNAPPRSRLIGPRPGRVAPVEGSEHLPALRRDVSRETTRPREPKRAERPTTDAFTRRTRAAYDSAVREAGACTSRHRGRFPQGVAGLGRRTNVSRETLGPPRQQQGPVGTPTAVGAGRAAGSPAHGQFAPVISGREMVAQDTDDGSLPADELGRAPRPKTTGPIVNNDDPPSVGPPARIPSFPWSHGDIHASVSRETVRRRGAAVAHCRS